MNTMLVFYTVLIIWGIAVITPGPNFFITVQTALSKKRTSTLFVILGIASGTAIWAIFGILGLTLLIKSAPAIYYIIKIAGGCYLIYLGIKLFITKEKNKNGFSGQNSSIGSLQSFRQGLFTNLSNPKTAFFITSLFASLPSSFSSHFIIGVSCVLEMFIISFLWYGFVAAIFSHVYFRNRYAKMKSYINKFSGVIFTGFGLKIVFSD